MDTPSGTTSARVADSMTRPFRFSNRGKWKITIFALAVAVGVGAIATAQDEAAPEPAAMARLASHALTLDAFAIDGAYVTVGERGHILISTDGGETWQQQQVPTRTSLTGVYFHDRNLGWAVGHDSAILRTTDGGVTWELVSWAPDDESPFFDVWFADADNGIAVGAYGGYYETADGGSSWSPRWISEDDWHLHEIARSGSGRLYIAGEAGSVYRSDDDGEDWVSLPTLYQGSYFGVLPLEEDTVLLFGLRGHLFRSEDAGESWEELETGTVSMLTDGQQLGDGTILITGLGGTVLTSSDGGRTFTLHQQANRRGISAVVETSDGSLLLVGEFGVRTATLSELTAGSD
jgi:photosystem II stability/assembly factor-like uncharacterized protein